MATKPNRVPRGVPAGGRFAASPHARPSFKLDDPEDERLTPTQAVASALAELLPGGYSAELDDQEILGPRGGLRGYRRAEGAWRPGDVMLTRAVCDASHCADDIEHGHSWWYERGGPAKRASSEFHGLTLRDAPEVRATIHAVLDMAHERRSWCGGLDLAEVRARIALEPERLERIAAYEAEHPVGEDEWLNGSARRARIEAHAAIDREISERAKRQLSAS
jgi:hypothetical protein